MKPFLAYTLVVDLAAAATLALCRYGPHDVGVAVAFIAAAVLCVECVNAVRRTRTRR